MEGMASPSDLLNFYKLGSFERREFLRRVRSLFTDQVRLGCLFLRILDPSTSLTHVHLLPWSDTLSTGLIPCLHSLSQTHHLPCLLLGSPSLPRLLFVLPLSLRSFLHFICFTEHLINHLTPYSASLFRFFLSSSSPSSSSAPSCFSSLYVAFFHLFLLSTLSWRFAVEPFRCFSFSCSTLVSSACFSIF